MADRIGPRNSWDWRRPIRDGCEDEELDQLKETLKDCELTDKPDGWRWNLVSNGIFSVGSMRRAIENSYLGMGEKETIWITLTPPKVNIFMWRVMLDRVPTRDNLNKMKLDLNSLLCPVCGFTTETINHVLFDCPAAIEVWKFIERWWSISFPAVKSLESMLNGVNSTYKDKQVKEAVEAIIFISCYCMWCFRNRCVFDNPPPRKDSLLDQIVEKSFFWLLARCKGSDKIPITWRYHPFDCIM